MLISAGIVSICGFILACWGKDSGNQEHGVILLIVGLSLWTGYWL